MAGGFSEYRDPYADLSDIDAEEEVRRRLRLADCELAAIEHEIWKDMETGREKPGPAPQNARRRRREARP